MPRDYLRRTDKCNWTVDSLQRAIEATEYGLSIRKAAKLFEIPATTLRDRKKVQNYHTPKLGKYSVFNIEREKALAKRIVRLSRMFYGLTMTIVRTVAFEFAEINNVQSRFNSQKQIAGKNWADSFLKRNPRIKTLLKEKNLEIKVMSDETKFSSRLLKAMKKYKFTGNRIFCVDDVYMYPKTKLEEKRIPELSGKGNNVTVVCAASATGEFIPPMIIFPKGEMEVNMQQNGPSNAIYKCSQKGLLNEELFLDWLIFFNEKVRPAVDDPVLLLLDNQRSHISLKIYGYCKYYNIVLVVIPAHFSSKLQPLKMTFSDTLKGSFIEISSQFLTENSDQIISYNNFASLFDKAYSNVVTVDQVVSGFQVTGIFPLDTEKFGVEITFDDSSTDDDDETEIKVEESVIDIKVETLDEQLDTEELVTDTCERITVKSPNLGLVDYLTEPVSSHVGRGNNLDQYLRPLPPLHWIGSISHESSSNHSSEITTTALINTPETSTDASCGKRKLQESSQLRNLKKKKCTGDSYFTSSRRSSSDEVVRFKPCFNVVSPPQLLEQQPFASLPQQPVPLDHHLAITDNLSHKYGDLLNNSLMDDLSIDRDQLKKIVNQLDLAFNSHISQNSSSSCSISQTQEFNYFISMELFFKYMVKITKTLGPLEQVVLQKCVANIVFDMKIKQLES